VPRARVAQHPAGRPVLAPTQGGFIAQLPRHAAMMGTRYAAVSECAFEAVGWSRSAGHGRDRVGQKAVSDVPTTSSSWSLAACVAILPTPAALSVAPQRSPTAVSSRPSCASPRSTDARAGCGRSSIDTATTRPSTRPTDQALGAHPITVDQSVPRQGSPPFQARVSPRRAGARTCRGARWRTRSRLESGSAGGGCHWVTRCQAKGPNEVAVVGWFLVLAVRRRYSSGMVLPWTTMRWKFGTSYDGWLSQAS